jgi:hypothetical protein
MVRLWYHSTADGGIAEALHCSAKILTCKSTMDDKIKQAVTTSRHTFGELVLREGRFCYPVPNHCVYHRFKTVCATRSTDKMLIEALP